MRPGDGRCIAGAHVRGASAHRLLPSPGLMAYEKGWSCRRNGIGLAVTRCYTVTFERMSYMYWLSGFVR